MEHITLINENNEQLWRRLFIGTGSVINDAIESIFLNSIASAVILFVRLLNSGNLQVQFHAIKNLL